MKKILMFLTTISMTTSTSFSVLSCKTTTEYKEIIRPEPVYLIKQYGFKGFDSKKIDVKKYVYTYDLIDELNKYLQLAGYNLNNLSWDITRNKMILEKGLEDNLLRNGNYFFVIKNKLNENDKIEVKQKISNSKYLKDVILKTNLKDIEDNRVKTVLMKMIFNNLNLISRIDDIAKEMLNSENITITDKNAILNFKDFDKKNRDKFYGQITLDFNVTGPNPNWPSEKIDINNLAKEGGTNVKNDLGILKTVNPFQIFSQYVTLNFSNKLQYLTILVNDIDIEGIKINKIDKNYYKAVFETLKDTGSKYKNYLTGKLELTFNYFGNEIISR
ncbi:hypothetical protein [Spiroplasma floricola]|uniref:Lipoprotein n=1 Tax=Spiroplasma floricola 23-6 TaxID=1336749 RepID=A0A2K8SDR7_9MOLU|nr:hypothetical protein [Spiroplasma floricola]AUB31606.1 hypothetical protein SFLOR_v1c05540 [Spiroplasma floricola 23-6]